MSGNITTVRDHLLATLAELRDKTAPMDVARARAIAEVAGVLVDTARVEIDYLRAVGGKQAQFLEGQGGLPAPSAAPGQPPAPPLPPAMPFDQLTGASQGVIRHVLKG
jgi:hypothetical protein